MGPIHFGQKGRALYTESGEIHEIQGVNGKLNPNPIKITPLGQGGDGVPLVASR